MNCEYRVEIISNQSVMEDIVEQLEEEIDQVEYTIIENVHGKGLSSKKLGNPVWPEMNFLLFAYTDKESAKKIKDIIENMKQKHPREGMSCFFTKGEIL